MTQTAQKYNATPTTVTMTNAELPSSTTTGRISNYVSVSGMSTIPQDIGFDIQFTFGAGPTAGGFWEWYLLGAFNGGSSTSAILPGGAGFADAALNPSPDVTRFRLIEQVPIGTTTGTILGATVKGSLLEYFASLPAAFSFFCRNQSGVAGSSTGTFTVQYRPLSIEGV
jgi:hypothetical protein